MVLLTNYNLSFHVICIVLISFHFATAKKTFKTDTSNSNSLYTYEYFESKNVRPEQLDLLGRIKRYFHTVAADQSHQRNIVCSPVTVMLSMAKLALGARDRTQAQLFDALGVKKEARMKSKFRKMIHNLRYLPGVSLDIASRIFVSDKYKVQTKYNNKVKGTFKSDVETLNFANPQNAANRINDWVSKETKGKIQSIVSSRDIPQRTSIIILTAIHFMGRWMYPFHSVKPDIFVSPLGSLKVPMMRITRMYNYGVSRDLSSQLVEIPYVEGKASFLLVLPQEKNGLPQLIRQLKNNPDLLNKAMHEMSKKYVELSMPMFKIETELDLEKLLKEIHVTEIFNEVKSGLKHIVQKNKRADIGEDIRVEVFVSCAKQKASIEVTPTGTKGAAVDGIVVEPVKMIFDKEQLKADHPFLFYVKATKQQLFAGIYTGVE